MSRWCYLSEEERHDVHHALRMLLKHPLTPRGEEHDRIKHMADEIWEEHAERVAFKLAIGQSLQAAESSEETPPAEGTL